MDENTKLLLNLTQNLATQTTMLIDVRAHITKMEDSLRHLERRVNDHDVTFSQQQGVRKGMMLVLTLSGAIVGLLGGLIGFRFIFE